MLESNKGVSGIRAWSDRAAAEAEINQRAGRRAPRRSTTRAGVTHRRPESTARIDVADASARGRRPRPGCASPSAVGRRGANPKISAMRFSIWPGLAQPFGDVVATARHAEEPGWDGVYLADHFMGNNAEKTGVEMLDIAVILGVLVPFPPRFSLSPAHLSLPRSAGEHGGDVDRDHRRPAGAGAGAGW